MAAPRNLITQSREDCRHSAAPPNAASGIIARKVPIWEVI